MKPSDARFLLQADVDAVVLTGSSGRRLLPKKSARRIVGPDKADLYHRRQNDIVGGDMATIHSGRELTHRLGKSYVTAYTQFISCGDSVAALNCWVTHAAMTTHHLR